jgi:YggT family protein
MGAIFEPFIWLLGILVDTYLTIVIIQVIVYWLMNFNIIEVKNNYAQTTVELLDKATRPVYNKIGEKIPTVSGFDFSPFILVLVLLFLSRFLYRLDLMLM